MRELVMRLRLQFGMNARTPVDLSTGVVGCFDLLGEYFICSPLLAYRSLSPGIIATKRDPERLTEHIDRKVLAILFHGLIPRSWPCEKLLTVFLVYRVLVAFSPVPFQATIFFL